MLKASLGWLAVMMALMAAALWFRAATLKLDAADLGAYGGSTAEAVAQFARQARLNSWAAAATGISALLQAIVLLLP